MSGSKTSHFWRRDITGLRAVAVLPVLLFHAFPQTMPGGFFGVDIFFVISGYLISGIIFRGLSDGTFSYATFYAKRIRRIIPNLLLVLGFVMIVGWFFLTPGEYHNLGKHVYSSAAFSQNFRLLGEIGYFTEDALRKPLLHLWSLAIEEQFYIVFPILCALAWRLRRSGTALGILALLVTVCSLEACLLIRDKSYVFYFPLTRFWEIGVGILLAWAETFRFCEPARLARGCRSALSALGLGAVLVPMVFYHPRWMHPGWITLLPVAGAFLLISASADALVNRTLLAWRPMTFVGLISYSLYLWHWPLLAFLFICVPDVPAGCKIGALILSFAIATIVYFFVENPMRRLTRIGRVPSAAVLLILLVLVFGLGKTLQLQRGIPQRPLSLPVLDAVRTNEWAPHNGARRIAYHGVHLPVTLKDDRPASVLFVGDSHAAQYFARARVLSERSGRQTMFAARVNFEDVFDHNLNSKEAAAYRAALSDPQVKTVVLALKWTRLLHSPQRQSLLAAMKAQVRQRGDLKLFIVLDPPFEELSNRQGRTDPLLHVNRLMSEKEQSAAFTIREDSLPDDWRRANEWARRFFGDTAAFLDPTPVVWPNGECNLLHWYKDDDHFQPLRLEKEAVWIDPAYGA